MRHYLASEDGYKYHVDMGCDHPDFKNRNCNGKCEECKFAVATLKISDFLEIAKRAGCLNKF